jgi:hypothetical protein
VPPGIQIIPSVCGAPTVVSGLNVVAGKSVVISRAASRSIAKKLRSGPGYATQEAFHRLLDRGPTSTRSSQDHWDGYSGACAHELHCGDIGPLFLSGGKNPLILLTNSWAAEAGYAPKSVLRLQAGNVGPRGKIAQFVNL